MTEPTEPAQVAAGGRLQINPEPLKVTDFYCPLGCQRMHRDDCRHFIGGWFREAEEGRRIGTWYFYESRCRWELQRRFGKGEDLGWYLYGPEGSPFGAYLGRWLGPAKAIAEDYIHDVPGARDYVRRDPDGDIYWPRLEEHERLRR